MNDALKHAPDPVTGGLGRKAFSDKAKKVLQQYAQQYCLVSIDVREFKLVNVSFGRHVGNRLLRHIFSSIQGELDSDELLVRDSGDVFYVLMKDRDRQKILKRLKKIHQHVDDSQLFTSKMVSPYLALRFGIYLPHDNSEKLEEMLEYANMARKHTTDIVGCGEECFYDPKRAHRTLEEKQTIAELLQAFEKDQFEVYLQPKVSLKTGKVEGAEALVRWQHPQKGLCSPNSFIPTLEKYRLIHRLDILVFTKVCELLSCWTPSQRQECPVSVNLSRLTLNITELPTVLQNIVRRYSVESHCLELEITETSFVRDFQNIKRMINDFREAGFRCSIDDFGFGYSSLVCLSELSVDSVKFSRSFFLTETTKARLIIDTMAKLATDLGFKTVAEGIECEHQLERLKQTTCDLVQGFVYYEPMPIKQFEEAVFE